MAIKSVHSERECRDALNAALAQGRIREAERLAFAHGFYLNFGEYVAGFLIGADNLNMSMDNGMLRPGSYARGWLDGQIWADRQ